MGTPHPPPSSARLVTISIAFLAMLIVPGAHAVTFTAYALLDNPDQGHEFYTGGILPATITGLSGDLRIEISSAAASAQYNLQWSLQMECDGDIVTLTDDLESNYIATCNMAGWWEHKAGGTGRTAGTWNNTAVGAHTVASYAEFVDNQQLC